MAEDNVRSTTGKQNLWLCGRTIVLAQSLQTERNGLLAFVWQIFTTLNRWCLCFLFSLFFCQVTSDKTSMFSLIFFAQTSFVLSDRIHWISKTTTRHHLEVWVSSSRVWIIWLYQLNERHEDRQLFTPVFVYIWQMGRVWKNSKAVGHLLCGKIPCTSLGEEFGEGEAL